MLAARIILWVLSTYAGIGVVFAVAFVTRGIGVVDPATRGAGWGFRALVAPGSALLWPWLMTRWRRGSGR